MTAVGGAAVFERAASCREWQDLSALHRRMPLGMNILWARSLIAADCPASAQQLHRTPNGSVLPIYREASHSIYLHFSYKSLCLNS